MSNRLDHWERHLQDYLDSINSFEWGKTDCCMFSVGAVKAITGIDHGVDYQYNTEAGAAKVLLRHGGVEEIATKHLGASKLPSLARRGDIISFESGNGMALGVCIGVKIVAMQESGLTYFSMSKAIKAWSV